MPCRHCRKPRRIRRRGLCSECYYTPTVRRRYPPTSKFAPRYGDLNGQREAPDKATRAIPKSAAKIAVLAQRAAARQSLWHPDDTPDWAVASPEEIP